MAANGHCFVEWKEQFVSKERGKRVVHYFLKELSGGFVLAVVGTERSVRHMFYVVSEEFLNAYGTENSVHAGYRWRSRREVVNWLTSMLSKHHRHDNRSKSPKSDLMNRGRSQQLPMLDYKDSLARNLRGLASDIVWSGVAWTCGKQLKHYPAFCRNGTTIATQSFIFVMAEEENRHLAYLEDMYEDRKGQKKVKVRWFHHNQEVKGVISLRNPHPKEVFITPNCQVISTECVDGPAVVLTREHYEKCASVFPHALLAKVHLCFRQYKNNRVKPFNLSKLRGYLDQPIFSCLDPDFFEDEEFSPGDNVKLGAKRTRSGRRRQMLTYEPSYQKSGFQSRRLFSRKLMEKYSWYAPTFKVNEKIELLCQDSGIRGCWFRCTVLEVSRKQIKVQYDDVKDEDGYENLEEWIPSFRLAVPDKLGMRCSGRPTIRPAPPHNPTDLAFGVGDPVDSWWSDGWWEGVVTGSGNHGDESLQVYIASENLCLSIHKKHLRVSRDWLGDQWVNIPSNADILSVISVAINAGTNLPPITKKVKSDGFPLSCDEVPSNIKPIVVENEEANFAGLASSDGALKEMVWVSDEKQQSIEDKDNPDNGNHANDILEKNHADYDHGDDDDDDDSNDARSEDMDGDKLEIECEIAGQNCEAELMGVVA